MNITNELKTYVKGPAVSLKDAGVSFKICNSDFGHGQVKILVDDKEFLVSEKELLAAIRNATNDGKF